MSRPYRCLFGLETEYALTARRPNGTDIRPKALGEIMGLARRRHPSLAGPSASDLFLGCGCRLYIDVGNHIELSTAECTDPTDLVCAAVAGDRLLAELVDEVRRNGPNHVELFKNNVDYIRRVTWASHESYFHSCPPRQMRRIIPFLVTRIIFTGAGGFDTAATGANEFLLSPRVSFLMRLAAGDSTGARGIYHAKDEPLGRTGHRLHVLCSESVCSHVQLYLRFGTTALVAAMIDVGQAPPIQLADPMRAMRAITADVTCRTLVQLDTRRRETTLDLQRRYLRGAEDLCRKGDLPEWAPRVCRLWDDVLTRLEQGPAAVVGTLDWATKWALFQDLAEQAGCDFEAEWGRWSRIAHDAMESSTVIPAAMRKRAMAQRLGQLAEQALRTELARRGEDMEAFDRYWKLRARAIELDARYAQLVPHEKSVFAALDADGALGHAVDGVDADAIARAMTEPPAGGRAEARGRHIRSLAPRADTMRCNWDAIIDLAGSRVLEMPDPFSNESKWTDRPTDQTMPEIWQVIGRLSSVRRRRWLRGQSGGPPSLPVGHEVVIGQACDPAAARLLGCRARITAAESSGYRLDVDDGLFCWPRVCLGSADRIDARQAGVVPVPPRRAGRSAGGGV